MSKNLYPEKFYQFGKGAKIDDETINKWIDESIKDLEKFDNGTFCKHAAGDTFVAVFKRLGDYHVVVCKNYYDAKIDR